MKRRAAWKTVRDWTIVALAAGAVVGALWAIFRPETSSEPAIRVRLTAGRAAGERQRIAQGLRREAARHAIYLDLVDTAGTEAALAAVEAGKLDVALVQGGLDLDGRDGLRQVAALHVEPLHLLVRRELHAAATDHLSALRGKSIAIGEDGGGTQRLATEVLAFAGLKPGDYRADRAGYAELLGRQDASTLPDAVFTVSSLPSPVARALVRTHGYRLAPLPFFEAFVLGALDDDAAPRSPQARIDRRRLSAAEIPAYAYEVEPGVPPHATATFGARLLVVAGPRVPAAAVRRLLEVIFGSPFAQAVQPPIDAKLLEIPPEIPWHDGATAYLRRNAPMIAGDVVDLVEKELSIVGALIGGLFVFWQWARRRLRRARDRGFQSYILRVTDVERRAMALERGAVLVLPDLLALQAELGALKVEALDKFAEGGIDGEELMSGFLSHVSDARDYLTRLILHERENLEKRARAEGRDAPSLWRETVASRAEESDGAADAAC